LEKSHGGSNVQNVSLRIFSILLLAALSSYDMYAAAVGEYQVKAAFLYNFAQFVEWPPESFSAADEPIGMCVLGRNPFGSALQDAVRGKAVAGRSFTVREVSDTKQGTDATSFSFRAQTRNDRCHSWQSSKGAAY
jgi:hypothetical protein